jgi:hypothetical protein
MEAGEDVVIVPSLQDPEVSSRSSRRAGNALRRYLRMTPQPS